MRLAVTVGKNGHPGLLSLAGEWAEQLGLPLIERERGTLEELLKEENLCGLIIATAHGPRAYSAGGSLFFHPGMSALRIRNIREGKGDRMVEAMQLQEGMSVLDCTLGLAADACTAAFAVGAGGRVVGLEASMPVAFVIKHGLERYRSEDVDAAAAAQRIEVISSRAEDYFAALPDDCFDIVYFDPMFSNAIKGSSAMNPLRPLAFAGELSESALLQAKRVARQRVVLKSGKYDRLPLENEWQTAPGGKYSSIKYSVIEVGT